MKTNKSIILLIVLIVLTIVGLTTLMICLMNKKINIKSFGIFNQKIENLEIDETYENIYEKINIETEASDIEIKTSDSDNIKIKIYSEKEKAKITDKETELDIRVETKECKFICLNKKISKIELYLPENYEKEININNKYGDIDIKSFEKSNINIIEDAGDIKLEKANKVDIKNNYGDIKIDEIKQGNIKQSAGDVEINKVDNIKIKNNYGDIKINEISEYIEIDEDAGDVKIKTINITKDSSIKNNVGDIRIEKTNDIYIDAKTDVGSTRINENNHKSDITLKIENNVGDIKVN